MPSKRSQRARLEAKKRGEENGGGGVEQQSREQSSSVGWASQKFEFEIGDGAQET